jgi:hypothetical protein
MGQTQRMVSDIDIIDAMTTPPEGTRAARRAELVREVLSRKGRKLYMIDWNGVALGAQEYVDLSDPYDSGD